MGLFSSLGDKLNHVFSKLKSRGTLTEHEIKQAMREIRIALLEADVNFNVVKDFVARISEKAVGEDIIKSLTPGQQVIKVVNDELVALLGTTNAKLEVSPKPPTVIMMCGLQGAGKTTMCGKLAQFLTKQGKKPLLVACDIYRPAAINQLKVVGKSVNTEVFEKGTNRPDKTAKEAIDHAVSKGYDTVIIDTAGRLHINDELMKELEAVKKITNPTEILLVVDSMTGQDAVTAATSFNARLDLTGVILTKLDGDTRGGAALSIRAVTGKPIKFSGVGEKMGDIEPFYPDRMASRILGMGDVLTLIEKAQSAVTEEEVKKMEERLLANKFTFDDYLVQMKSLKKMGNLEEIAQMIPGMSSQLKGAKLDDNVMAKNQAIIQSMTPKERANPDLIKSSRRKRIASGSGTSVQEVNQLLKQFVQIRDMMKSFNKKGAKGMQGMPQMKQMVRQKQRFKF
ncbi:MAG: signal recognition particle protein [Firmicutes bacterium]|nr:signal recognition particle protein [Bacillota bacterium]